MEICQQNKIKQLHNITIVLGFFDGIHLGHRAVISNAVDYAKKNNSKTLLITFQTSPEYFFKNNFQYIYPRKVNYALLEECKIDYILEENFPDIANQSPDKFLFDLCTCFKPIAIFTGYNYTFGKNKSGNPDFLKINSAKYNYEYFCIPEVKLNNTTVCSTKIKEFLSNGQVLSANKFLGKNFFITSKVIHGMKIGRTLGFPTANLIYPQNIIKLPYGVYKVLANDSKAVLNWGNRPTIGNSSESLEVHIINCKENLYDKILCIQFVDKIREEKNFDTLEQLKLQIKRDIDICSK